MFSQKPYIFGGTNQQQQQQSGFNYNFGSNDNKFGTSHHIAEHSQIMSVENNIINCMVNTKREILEEIKKLSVPNTHTIPNNTIHSGISCDVCFKQNIVGNRYKCFFCKDFDLCKECEKIKETLPNNGAHTKNHSFIKIENTETFLCTISTVSNAFVL